MDFSDIRYRSSMSLQKKLSLTDQKGLETEVNQIQRFICADRYLCLDKGKTVFARKYCRRRDTSLQENCLAFSARRLQKAIVKKPATALHICSVLYRAVSQDL
jgi:hypothetical protein